jgi:nucleoid-associated protein YgaU
MLQNVFRGVRGGSSANGTSRATASEKDETSNSASRWYIVVTGDSLSTIAKREYGNASDWPKIYWANRKIVKSPTLIQPGLVLRIP